MNESRKLAAWVAETPYEALPREVIDLVRIFVLDGLASGLAGVVTPWAGMVADMVQAGSTGPASLFGRSSTTSLSAAALFNGVCVGGFETDGPYSPGSCHPSAAVLPAVLAVAEQQHLSGPEFIAAIALGYEGLCRVGAAATRAVEDERGFHGPGTNSAFGGAFGAGRAFGFDAATMLHAIGIAGSHGGGLLEFHHEGAMTKRLHIGRGSQMGLESALLAAKGFTGPSTVLEGEHGFLNVYSPSPKPELLLKELGEKWLLKGMAFKAHPCHMSFHAVVDAIWRFKWERGFTAADVESVEVRSNARMMEDRFSERAPTSLMGAQYSLPWSTAHALLHDASDPASWTDEALKDATVNKLAASVTLTEAPAQSPNAVADIILRLRGQQHVIPATDWKGAPTNPVTLTDVAQKLGRYAAGVIDDARIEELIGRVDKLEGESDVSGLIALIRG